MNKEQNSETSAKKLLFPTLKNQGIKLGGLSGLSYHAGYFYTHTDRGPNSEGIDLDQDGFKDRIFYSPNFKPTIIKFKIDSTITVKEFITVKNEKANFSGIPNLDKDSSFGFFDERAFDKNKNIIQNTLFGIDPEAITIDSKNRIWIAEEYGPSILITNSQGHLLKKMIPKKSHRLGVETLPSFLNSKKLNRGFEGITYADGKIYCIIQSPIPNKKEKKKFKRMIHIFEFDESTLRLSGHYLYKLSKKAKKIGAMTVYKEKKFLIIEQDGDKGKKSYKKVIQIDLDKATNLLANWSDSNLTKSFKELKTNSIIPAHKKDFLNLNDYDLHSVEKIEGLHYLNNHLYLIIDNDFALRENIQNILYKIPLN